MDTLYVLHDGSFELLGKSALNNLPGIETKRIADIVQKYGYLPLIKRLTVQQLEQLWQLFFIQEYLGYDTKIIFEDLYTELAWNFLKKAMYK